MSCLCRVKEEPLDQVLKVFLPKKLFLNGLSIPLGGPNFSLMEFTEAWVMYRMCGAY